MTSTCGSIRWGRAEGQYLFKLITRGRKACVCVHTYSCLVFIVHMCGKEDKWGSMIVYTSLHMSMHRHGFYWYKQCKHTLLWCDPAWASVWPPSASMTSSAPNGLQLSLGVINIPAVEILACVGKHDKTATHLPLCSQHSLSFVRGSHPNLGWPQIISDRSFIFSSACLSLTRTVTVICFLFFLERRCRAVVAAAAAPPDSSIQLQVKSYLPWSLPNVLFAPQANKSHCAPWQILIDTFRAIIQQIFYRDTLRVLMEPRRNITWNLAVGGCWHRPDIQSGKPCAVAQSVDTLTLWQL